MQMPVRLLLLFWFLSTFVSFTSSDAEKCVAQPLPDSSTSNQEQLVYVKSGSGLSGRLTFTNTNVNPIEFQYFHKALISPNGEYIATSTSDDGKIDHTVVFNNLGKQIYSGAPSQASIVDVRWLGDEKVLSFFFRRVTRDPLSVIGGTEYDFGYFLIDPFARAYTFVQPPRKPPFYTEIPDKSFLEGYHNFTYDGRYLFAYNYPIFDFKTQQPLTLKNFRVGIPATNSHRLIGIDWATDSKTSRI